MNRYQPKKPTGRLKKLCGQCGQAFYAALFRRIYCSVGCRVKAHRRTKRGQKTREEGES